MDVDRSLERARTENRIVAEIAGLAASEYDYADVVQSILNLIEQAVSSPFLSLTVQESGQVGQYARNAEDVDPAWAEDVGRYVADSQRRQLSKDSAAGQRPATQYVAVPEVWLATFPARTRSGRQGALILGCAEPFSMEADEGEVMMRLALHSLLVLDHALLLEQMERLEMTDSLTGAVNHRRLLEILEYEMRRHRYLDRRLNLVLLDVEGLGGINRTYGRYYGNHILGKLAGLLRETVRPIDVIARSGMDEFAVVLPESDEAEATELAEQIRSRIRSMGFASGTVELTVELTQVKPEETLTAEGFLRRGEQAVREAKRRDRNWKDLWLAERPPAPY